MHRFLRIRYTLRYKQTYNLIKACFQFSARVLLLSHETVFRCFRIGNILCIRQFGNWFASLHKWLHDSTQLNRIRWSVVQPHFGSCWLRSSVPWVTDCWSLTEQTHIKVLQCSAFQATKHGCLYILSSLPNIISYIHPWVKHRNLDTSLSSVQAMNWTAWVSIPGTDKWLSSKMSRLALKPTHPSIHRVPVLYQGGKATRVWSWSLRFRMRGAKLQPPPPHVPSWYA